MNIALDMSRAAAPWRREGAARSAAPPGGTQRDPRPDDDELAHKRWVNSWHQWYLQHVAQTWRV